MLASMKRTPQLRVARRRLVIERIVCNVAATAAVAAIFAAKATEAQTNLRESRIETAARHPN